MTQQKYAIGTKPVERIQTLPLDQCERLLTLGAEMGGINEAIARLEQLRQMKRQAAAAILQFVNVPVTADFTISMKDRTVRWTEAPEIGSGRRATP